MIHEPVTLLVLAAAVSAAPAASAAAPAPSVSAAAPAPAAPLGAPSSTRTLDMRVPVAPVPVAVDGARLLVYELHLTGFGDAAVQLRRLDVLADDGVVVAAFDGAALAGRVARAGGERIDGDVPTVPPGTAAIVFIELVLPDGAVGESLVHRVAFAHAGGPTQVETGARVAIDTSPPPVLGPPLRGGTWAALYHPSWARGHRRVHYVEGGTARLPGRFAIDFFGVGDDGRLTRGDRDVVANWVGYRAPVLAVADAVVVAARDDVPESPRISEHPRLPLEDATGSYIALDLGDGRFVFYEHLQAGSVRVVPGQRVARGDVIGAVGFTGHTSGPHLHFHVADANSPLGAEGVPYVFDGFAVLGSLGEDIGPLFRGESPPPHGTAPDRRTAERPAPNTLIRFPDR